MRFLAVRDSRHFMPPPRQAHALRTFLAGLAFLAPAIGGISLGRAAQGVALVQEDFGRYVVEHQADLAPFFARNGNELVGEAAPLVLQWIGTIIFVALAAGWGIDILLGRGFANLFAPHRDKFAPAFLYATGRLTINILLLLLLETLLMSAIGHARGEITIISLVALVALLGGTLQVGWISYFYRTRAAISLLFYLTLVVIHGFLTLGVASPLSRLHASRPAVAFMDQTVTPRIEAEARRMRHEMALAAPERNEIIAEYSRRRGQVEQAQAEQLELRKRIELAKNSEAYVFSEIVKVQARGDLAAARDQFAALLNQFPEGPMTARVKSQLTLVSNELAAQDAQTRQEAAEKSRLAARARADLLARAGRGQATLSELRQALLGKTPTQVSALFGPPTETASDRWGFSRQMVFNPLTNERSGLAIYFADGSVQSVDYYYGSEAVK